MDKNKFKQGDKVKVDFGDNLRIFGDDERAIQGKIGKFKKYLDYVNSIALIKLPDGKEESMHESYLELVESIDAAKNNNDGMIYNPYTDSWSWF